MYKEDLIKELAKRADTTQIITRRVVDSFIDILSDELAKEGGFMSVMGFGKFTTSHIKERQVPHIHDKNKLVTVPAHRVVKFKAGKILKNKIN